MRQWSHADRNQQACLWLYIVTIIASEIVIGYWREARDDGLRAVGAMLSEAQWQTDGPAAAEATVLRAIPPTATRAAKTQE